MAKLGGFWSYTHKDDQAEFGGITKLAEDIVSQYELLTGESIELFIDRDSIVWGNAWVERVDGSLANVAFFIPVITPNFFQSVECRRELRRFIDRAESLGVTELIMPLLYVEFPELYLDPQPDDLITSVTKYQWERWTDLRFEERGSGAYRRGVAALAQRLADANSEIAAAVAESPVPSQTAGGPDEANADDDTPGTLDLMADAETTMPKWGETLGEISTLTGEIGVEFEEASARMAAADARGKGFAGRLTVARQLGQKLNVSGDRMIKLAEDFTAQLSSVDSGIRTIIQMAPDSVDSPEDRAAVYEFFDSVEELVENADDGLSSTVNFTEQIEPLETISRDLRAPLKKWRRALTVLSEGRQIVGPWAVLVEEARAKIELSE